MTGGISWRRSPRPPVAFDANCGVAMKTIITSSGDFVTGTEIADAVTAYGLALARVRGVDVVDIPFVAVDGSAQRVQFRVGWNEPTAATSDGEAVEELLEIVTTLELHAKARSVTLAREAGGYRLRADRIGDTDWDEII